MKKNIITLSTFVLLFCLNISFTSCDSSKKGADTEDKDNTEQSQNNTGTGDYEELEAIVATAKSIVDLPIDMGYCVWKDIYVERGNIVYEYSINATAIKEGKANLSNAKSQLREQLNVNAKYDKNLQDFYGLNANVDYSTTVYVLKATVNLEKTNYYTKLNLTATIGGKAVTVSLYCSGAAQYTWLQAFKGQEVTIEIAPCNWNDKEYWVGCVLAVRTADGKVLNTLNFDKY